MRVAPEAEFYPRKIYEALEIDSCPESAYLKTGVNGLLAPYNDLNSLVKAILTVLENQEHFSSQAYEYAQSHLQLQGMIDGLVQAIEHAESCALKKQPL